MRTSVGTGVQILAAIFTSVPAVTKTATILWGVGVPNLDAAIITGAATSSSERPGTSTGNSFPAS